MAALNQQLCCRSSFGISPSSSSSSISAIHSSGNNSSSSSCCSSGARVLLAPHLFYRISCFETQVVLLPRELRLARGASSYRSAVRRSARPGTGTGTVVCLQQQQELPAKLQEIVKLFKAVPDSKQKYEQLLYYAKQLKPLPKEFHTKENKVEGCVSQVWVRATLTEDRRVYFEADSDSLLTKGLAALLVEGLSGASVSEVLKVTPDFIQMLGLKQSLTPSRSNGFLNMLKLMQKKTLNLYMEAESAKSIGASSVKEVSSQAGTQLSTKSEVAKLNLDRTKNISSFGASAQMSKKDSIHKKLQEALAPTVLEVDDVSHQHAGHAGVHKGATETHFNVKVVSEKFTGTSLIKRHRVIYDLLDEELKNGVHALSLVTKTPKEIGK